MVKTTVSDSYHLNELLKTKYGERLETDPFAALRGSVQGTFDSKKINITFKGNEYLLISTASTSREVLDELLPVLTEVMGGEKPICSYDLQSSGIDEKDAMPTIEWDVVAPEDRIKEIVNGRAFSDGAKIHNLKLYNSKNVSDYLESEEEKENRIKNARIYGIDPGCCDPEKIKNLSELDLYFQIDAMGAHLWYCRHEMSHGRIEQIDLTEEEYAIEYMVYQTTKFGVELPEPEIDKHVTATPSYNAWYKFYSNHFKNVLSDEEWHAFQRARENGEDISAYMPTGNWQDLLEKSTQKTLKKQNPKVTL